MEVVDVVYVVKGFVWVFDGDFFCGGVGEVGLVDCVVEVGVEGEVLEGGEDEELGDVGVVGEGGDVDCGGVEGEVFFDYDGVVDWGGGGGVVRKGGGWWGWGEVEEEEVVDGGVVGEDVGWFFVGGVGFFLVEEEDGLVVGVFVVDVDGGVVFDEEGDEDLDVFDELFDGWVGEGVFLDFKVVGFVGEVGE